MKRATAEKMCEHITDSVRTVMKAWDESLHPRDENGRFTSGGGGSSAEFVEYTRGDETWYEAEIEGVGRARVREEEPGNGWYTAEMATGNGAYEYLRNADGNAMTFETVSEAQDEAKYALSHAPGTYTDDADTTVRASSRFVGDDNLKNQAKDYLNHHLLPNDDYCTVDEMRIIQNPTSSGVADVEVEYTVDMSIPVGMDQETGRMEYDSDTDYRTKTLQLKVWN